MAIYVMLWKSYFVEVEKWNGKQIKMKSIENDKFKTRKISVCEEKYAINNDVQIAINNEKKKFAQHNDNELLPPKLRHFQYLLPCN